MKVSVIIPCFNAEKYIQESINSILHQSHKDIEVIVIDDSSIDDSFNHIKSFQNDRLFFFRNERNIGYLKTINKLLRQTTGDFIAFQDADDISHKDRLKIQIEYLKINPNVSIVGTNYSIIDKTGSIIKSCMVEDDQRKIISKLPFSNPFQKPSILFKREVYDKIGGFREEFLKLKNISEDYDWLLRASHFFQMGNINHEQSLYYYRSVATAMTKGFDNVDQIFGHKVAQFLYKQRLLTGVDSLMKGDIQTVKNYIEELKVPYAKDKSKFHRERAEALMYAGLKSEAIVQAAKALYKKPSISNLKLLQYCLRKKLLGL